MSNEEIEYLREQRQLRAVANMERATHHRGTEVRLGIFDRVFALLTSGVVLWIILIILFGPKFFWPVMSFVYSTNPWLLLIIVFVVILLLKKR